MVIRERFSYKAIHEVLSGLLEQDLHAKRVNSLCDDTLGVQAGACAARSAAVWPAAVSWWNQARSPLAQPIEQRAGSWLMRSGRRFERTGGNDLVEAKIELGPCVQALGQIARLVDQISGRLLRFN